MFEDSLVESAALLRTRNRWPALLSVTAQCAVATLIVSLPLLHPEILTTPRLVPPTFVPLRTPVQPPPPPVHLEARASAAAASAPTAPAAIHSTSLFRDLIHPSGQAVDAPSLAVVNLGNNNPSLSLGINSAAPAGPRVTIAQTPSAAHSRLNISSGVSAGLLLAPIRAQYPEIARITRTEGTVIVEAVISRTGTIESAHVLSGPPMLQRAALDAVQQARYRPFLLNGQPTDVQTTVTVVFRMGS